MFLRFLIGPATLVTRVICLGKYKEFAGTNANALGFRHRKPRSDTVHAADEPGDVGQLWADYERDECRYGPNNLKTKPNARAGHGHSACIPQEKVVFT